MRILLVDDERRMVTALQRGLRAEGHEVEVAFDGINGQRAADDYLTKPFHYVALLARLRVLLRRAADTSKSSSADVEALLVGDLKIDPPQRRCWRGGEEVTLTAKEFDLLAYLAERPRTVVSKDELIDALWDRAAPAAQNVVEVHMSSLRRKIDVPHADRSVFGKMLHTVRGVGYRLAPSETNDHA